MFAGHFGLAAGVRAKYPEVPLWALMLGTQLLDVLFVPLFVAGVETMDDHIGNGYGEAIIHADYTHSLLGALLLSGLAWIAAKRFWGARGGRVLAAVVFSHWLLDLIVHRADMPILPGNWGGLPTLGLGAWSHPGLAISLELALLAAGLGMYVHAAMKASAGRKKRDAYLSGAVLGCLLVFALVNDVLGLF
ncbi:permease [Brevibacillus fluminis]|uniref:permease n=1 Tax=Brevibacillus fluminis TaxID=511487 RepID=UPI003F8893BE